MPPLPSLSYSHPVSDISFGRRGTILGTMLLAERSMNGPTHPGAHESRVLEYGCRSGSWVPIHDYAVGASAPFTCSGSQFPGFNSAGGVDFDYAPGFAAGTPFGRTWATADVIAPPLDPYKVYGIQGFPPDGGNPSNSAWIDFDGNPEQDKTQIGDVEVPCVECLQPPDTMTAWWPLDEGGTAETPAFELIAGVNGSYDGGAGHDVGKVDGAVLITDAAQFVTVGNHPNIDFGTESFSIDAWVRTLDAATAVRVILDKRKDSPPLTGYALSISFGRLVFQLADGIGVGFTNYVQAAAGNLTNGVWHHVAATVDRGTDIGTLYVDGNVVHTFTPSDRPNVTNAGDLTIGQAFNGSGINFNGYIDEVELFRRPLRSLEVRAIYEAGSLGKCKPTSTVSVTDEPESGSLDRAVGFPNPFGTSTGVRFSLEKETDVDVRVFDVAGREFRTLRSGHFGAGRHYVPWDGRDADGVQAKAGVYFIRVQSGERVLNSKVVRVK